MPEIVEPVEAEISIELAEAPATPEIVEPVVEPIEAEPAPDNSRVAELEAQLSAALSERDMAIGRASEAEAKVPALEARIGELETQNAAMQLKLSDYEMGAALSFAGLPTQAGPLVKMAYDREMSLSRYPVPLRDWLMAALLKPEYAALSMLKSTNPGDPRASTIPVAGTSSLAQPPSFSRS